MASSNGGAKTPTPTPGRSGGALTWILPLGLTTVLAAGAGGFLGLQVLTLNAAVHPAEAPKPVVEASHTGDSAVMELHPVVTNLAAPEGAWVRLQASIVYDKTALHNADAVAAQIDDDALAYLKTLSVAQIQGASGLQAVREDLNERASIRSDGHVQELVIEMLVVR
jgi:flagellar FliL protein